MICRVNDVDLFYKKSGSGSPLILLHGNSEDHHIFDEISEKLCRHFTVFAVDSRNHGQSAKTDVYSYEAMTQDIHSFIDALAIKGADLVGFSDGAVVGLMLAIAHPGDIRRMALLGVNLSTADYNEKSFNYIRDTYEETGDPLFRMMLEQKDIAPDDVARVDIPTLLVAAERDIYRPELYDELLRTLPGAELKIMQGHKHETYIVGQDILYDDLCRFFGVDAS